MGPMKLEKDKTAKKGVATKYGGSVKRKLKGPKKNKKDKVLRKVPFSIGTSLHSTLQMVFLVSRLELWFHDFRHS